MPNNQVAVCILAKNYNTSAKRAICSAQKFGLHIYLGLTHDPIETCTLQGISITQISWKDDFSHVRNQLLDRVTHNFVLWIDSDEELFSFPKLNWEHFEENIFYIRTQFNSQFTPRVHVRMHKNSPNIRWQDRIHERLTVMNGEPYQSRFLSSLILRHDGYEDENIVLGKHARNLNIAQKGLETLPTYAELLTQARTETAYSMPNFMHWLNCYKTALVASDLRTQPSYFGFEAAFLMCIAGYSQPAEKLLEANPLNIYLQLAVLANKLKYSNYLDELKLTFVETCLQNGLYDVYENFPCELLGANKNKLLNYLQCWINEWENTTMDNPVFMENSRYMRCKSVDEQPFDEDLLLMNQLTRKVVVLNAASTVLWRLLEAPTSSEDLTSILNEALPNEWIDNKKASVNKLLVELFNAGLIQQVNH
jgi:hypothetical protein